MPKMLASQTIGEIGKALVKPEILYSLQFKTPVFAGDRYPYVDFFVDLNHRNGATFALQIKVLMHW